MSNYEILRKEFPNAKIKGSTFEEYFAEVNKIRDSLPVIRQEVGDTWIQGIASDPYKMANYRAVSEAITECVIAGTCTLYAYILLKYFCLREPISKENLFWRYFTCHNVHCM